TISTVDSTGLWGGTAQAPPITVAWNVVAGSAAPGTTLNRVTGAGFGPQETVDLHLDSPTGSVLAVAVTTSTGTFKDLSVVLPTPLAGGTHMLIGVGRTSGIVGPGALTVTSTVSMVPGSVGAGDVVTLSGDGFAGSESITSSFPGYAPTNQTADPNG